MKEEGWCEPTGNGGKGCGTHSLWTTLSEVGAATDLFPPEAPSACFWCFLRFFFFPLNVGHFKVFIEFVQYYFCCMFWFFGQEAYGILVP